MKQDTLTDVVPLFGRLIGMTTEEMEEVTTRIKDTITDDVDMFEQVEISAGSYSNEDMFAGALLATYLLTPLMDE